MIRVMTLKASTDRLGGLLAYFVGLAEDRAHSGGLSSGPVDYYGDPDELAGRWWAPDPERSGCRTMSPAMIRGLC